MEWVVSKKSNELRVMSTARVLVLIGQLADLLKKKKKKVWLVSPSCASVVSSGKWRGLNSAVSGRLWVYHCLILKQKYQENSSKAGTLFVLSISHLGQCTALPEPPREWTEEQDTKNLQSHTTWLCDVWDPTFFFLLPTLQAIFSHSLISVYFLSPIFSCMETCVPSWVP